MDPNFQPFHIKMQADGLPELAIKTFEYHFSRYTAGDLGQIPEDAISPVESLSASDALPDTLAEVGKAAFPKTIILKLNGGLGTGMGLEEPKSLLKVKEGLTFLDIIARQSLLAKVPLVFMNSFSTQAASRQYLAAYPDLHQYNLPVDFLQHKAPKINAQDASPAVWAADPAHEWAPPGHGDLYTALVTSGLLDTWLDAGYQYLFAANADNLGAVLDPKILGSFIEMGAPFMMEVTRRTSSDRKGGHLALNEHGSYILREIAQTPDAHLDAFQDIDRHKYFNTNNLWIHLPSLTRSLHESGGVLNLPLICNHKTVDPRNPASTPVIQLETAMGSAIGVFPGAQAIQVPRTRFAPVKTTDDLLVVRSDAFILDDQFQVIRNPHRSGEPPVVQLDPDFYKMIDQMEARFPAGAPSLVDCEALVVEGDVLFESGVVCKGVVSVKNTANQQRIIPQNTILQG